MTETKKFTTKPFLRWAGGKTRSIPFLEKHLPPNVSSMHRYYEPFIGAGSLFFHIKPSKAILSDNNKDLIECYETVQKRPDAILTYLEQYLSNTCEEYYYKMREKYNTSKHSIARAALFIYLNKTCFNGIWRVNKKGEFNVPYGFKEPPALPSKEELRNVSTCLSNVELIHSDYKEAVKNAKRDDFIYFDPPYLPINGTSCFTRYTRDRFTKDDHDELALLAKKLTSKGCYVLISNADGPYIRSLYEDDFNIFELEVTRWIRSDGKRYKVKEVAITNYDV
jgi:DNA adenine methylase